MKFSDAKEMEEVYLQPFGIRQKHLQDVLDDPDEVQHLEFGDLAIDISMKTSDVTTPGTTIIVLENRISPTEKFIESAYKTHIDALDIPDKTKPYDVLKHLAEKFGIKYKVGDQEGRFFGKQTIPLDISGRNSQDIVRPLENDEYVSTFYIRRMNDNIEIALLFSLKKKVYLDWLSKLKS